MLAKMVGISFALFFVFFFVINIYFMIRLPRGSFHKSVVANYTKYYNSFKIPDDYYIRT